MDTHTTYAYGVHAIEAALQYAPGAIKTLYIDRERKGFDDIPRTVSVQYVPYDHIEHMAPGEKHQGVIAEFHEFPYTAFADVDLASANNILICEEIQDPRNLGAIIRSAAAFNVDAIVIKKNKQVPITSAVIQSSVGAVFQVPIIQVPNIRSVVETCQDNDFWVYGLASEGTETIWNETYTEKTVFIVGSEGAGLRAQTREICDHLIAIPISGIESLNASVATALLLYERRRQQDH